MSATLSDSGGTLRLVTSIIEQTAADAIAVDLASHACAYADPRDAEHDHNACLDAPSAGLADWLWVIAERAAADDWKGVRTAVRRLDQAIGAGHLP